MNEQMGFYTSHLVYLKTPDTLEHFSLVIFPTFSGTWGKMVPRDLPDLSLATLYLELKAETVNLQL